MEDTITHYYAAEFDDCPNHSGKVILRETGLETTVSIDLNGTETVLIQADRDQWGVFLEIGGICIAQEDQTRSFLDALSKVLNELRRKVEFETKEATNGTRNNS
jgi:hypothetical protein